MSKRCEQCEIMYINGVRCHETGCPSAWKDEKRECRECGTAFEPEDRNQQCCSHVCGVVFSGRDCGCEECMENIMECIADLGIGDDEGEDDGEEYYSSERHECSDARVCEMIGCPGAPDDTPSIEDTNPEYGEWVRERQI